MFKYVYKAVIRKSKSNSDFFSVFNCKIKMRMRIQFQEQKIITRIKETSKYAFLELLSTGMKDVMKSKQAIISKLA